MTNLSSPTTPRAKLEEELRRANVQLEQLEAAFADALADPDVIQEDRDASKAMVEQARRRRDAAEAALASAAEGTYGVCERCGDTIPPERLEALPEATMCVRCAAAP